MKIEIDPRRVNAMHCVDCALTELLASLSPDTRAAAAEDDRQNVRLRLAVWQATRRRRAVSQLYRERL